MVNHPSFMQFQRDCFNRNLKSEICKHTSNKCRRTGCTRIDEYNKKVESFFIKHKGLKARHSKWEARKKRKEKQEAKKHDKNEMQMRKRTV